MINGLLQVLLLGLYKRVGNHNLIFLLLNPKIFCGYSKEQSPGDGSFEHSKHMFKLKDKKILRNLHSKCSRIFTNALCVVI